MEGRIERPCGLAKTLLETCWMRSEMAQPCSGPTEECAEDQQVERALRKIDGAVVMCSPLASQESMGSLVEVQGERLFS